VSWEPVRHSAACWRSRRQPGAAAAAATAPWPSAEPARFNVGLPGPLEVPTSSRAAAKDDPSASNALDEPLPEPGVASGESFFEPPPFSLSFRLEDDRRPSRRSLSLSLSRRRKLAAAACCDVGVCGGSRGGSECDCCVEDGGGCLTGPAECGGGGSCCCCCSCPWESASGETTEDAEREALRTLRLEGSQVGVAKGRFNGDDVAAGKGNLDGPVVVVVVVAPLNLAGLAEEGVDEDAILPLLPLPLALHLTVTRPEGSERNHSERCFIRSVCLSWTCVGEEEGNV